MKDSVEARKCNFCGLSGNYDRQTNEQTDQSTDRPRHREATLPTMLWEYDMPGNKVFFKILILFHGQKAF